MCLMLSEMTGVYKFWVHGYSAARRVLKKKFFLIRKFSLGAKYAYLVPTMTPFFLTS